MDRLIQFNKESDLQEFMHACLGGEREVPLGNGRIDLRLDTYDIEIKPVLTKSALDKAAGQLYRYLPYADGRKQIIAGCTPDRVDTGLENQVTALREAGLEVWFVDQMEVFQNKYREMYSGRQWQSDNLPSAYTEEYESSEPYVHSVEAGSAFKVFVIAAAMIGAALLGMFGSTDNHATISTPAGQELRLKDQYGAVIESVPYGASVKVIGPVEADGYRPVETDSGQRGYMKNEYLDF